MNLEEQMGTVNRGFTEEQLARLNTFIFNSKFNPNCNNQDRFFFQRFGGFLDLKFIVVRSAVQNMWQEID